MSFNARRTLNRFGKGRRRALKKKISTKHPTVPLLPLLLSQHKHLSLKFYTNSWGSIMLPNYFKSKLLKRNASLSLLNGIWQNFTLIRFGLIITLIMCNGLELKKILFFLYIFNLMVDPSSIRVKFDKDLYIIITKVLSQLCWVYMKSVSPFWSFLSKILEHALL